MPLMRAVLMMASKPKRELLMMSAYESVKQQVADSAPLTAFERGLRDGTISQDYVNNVRVEMAARIAQAETPDHAALWTYRAELLEATVAAYS